MRILLAFLYALNTFPLLVYPFVFQPLVQLIVMGGGGSDSAFFERFSVLGFAWSTLLYPVVLAYSHWNSISQQRRGEDGLAVRYQLVSTFGLSLIFVYFVIGGLYP